MSLGQNLLLSKIFAKKLRENDRNWTVRVPGFPLDLLLFCVEGIMPSFHLFVCFSGSAIERNVPAMQLGLLVSSDRAASQSMYIIL